MKKDIHKLLDSNGIKEGTIVYMIRTEDGKPIVFDPEEQLVNNGIIEFKFPNKDLALIILEEIRKVDPETKFILIAEKVDIKHIDYIMTEAEIAKKAEEENNIIEGVA